MSGVGFGADRKLESSSLQEWTHFKALGISNTRIKNGKGWALQILQSEKLQIKLHFSNSSESIAAICRFFFRSSTFCNRFHHARCNCRHSPPGEKWYAVKEGEQKRTRKEKNIVLLENSSWEAMILKILLDMSLQLPCNKNQLIISNSNISMSVILTWNTPV